MADCSSIEIICYHTLEVAFDDPCVTLMSSCSSSSFRFPQIHSFPPFYTRQLHEETWRKQRDLWIETILGFCAVERIFEIDFMDDSLLQSRLFYNPEIDRKLDREFLQELLKEMVKTEKAAFLTNSKALIYWHKPAEWAQLIYKFVERIGGIGSIYTVYDLIEGDESHNEEFHNLPEKMLKIVISELEKTGKVRLFSDSASSLKESGLKFF